MISVGRALLVVAGRELSTSMISPTSWLLHAVFLALQGALFLTLLALDAAVRDAILAGAATAPSTGLLGSHVTNAALLVVLIVPLFTQRLMPGSDRGVGLIHATSPIGAGPVVTGLWLATTVRVTALLWLAFLGPLSSPTMTAHGGPSPLWLAGTLALFAAATVAVGTLAAAVAPNRTTAAVLAWAGLLALWTVGRGGLGGAWFSLGHRLERMASGLAESGDIGFLLGVVAACLGLATWALESRRWR